MRISKTSSRRTRARRWAPEPSRTARLDYAAANAAYGLGSPADEPLLPCDADHGAVATDDGQRLRLGPTRDLQTETVLATPSRGTPTFGSPKLPRASSSLSRLRRVCSNPRRNSLMLYAMHRLAICFQALAVAAIEQCCSDIGRQGLTRRIMDVAPLRRCSLMKLIIFRPSAARLSTRSGQT